MNSFKVGPAYDPINVGLAANQTKFNYTQQTDNCVDPRAPTGDGHCGHEFGTNLSSDEKKALLEYLKSSEARPKCAQKLELVGRKEHEQN